MGLFNAGDERLGVAVLGAVAVGALGLVPGQAIAADKPLVLKFSTYVNEVDVRHKGFEYFGAKLKEKTQGRVEIQMFGADSLHPYAKAIDAIQSGIAGISHVTGSAADQRVPCIRRTQWSPALVQYDKYLEIDAQYRQLMEEELAKIGLFPVVTSSWTYDQNWFFRKPVKALSDMKGLLIRSSAPMVTHLIDLWGGKPVVIAPAEVYQAAERGVVDGLNMGTATFASWKLWEVMPYVLNVRIEYGNALYSMKLDTYKSLSAADQKAIIEAGIESQAWLKPRYEEWINGEVGKAVMNSGVTVITPTLEERRKMSAEALASWWGPNLDKDCGPELGKKVRDLFNKYKL